MNGDAKLYQVLEQLDIQFDYHEHPPGPTVEEALKYWKDIDSAHCKNIFFRKTLHFIMMRYPETELHQFMVKKKWTVFDRVCHAHLV